MSLTWLKGTFETLNDFALALKRELLCLQPKDSDTIKWTRDNDGMSAHLITDMAGGGLVQNTTMPIESEENERKAWQISFSSYTENEVIYPCMVINWGDLHIHTEQGSYNIRRTFTNKNNTHYKCWVDNTNLKTYFDLTGIIDDNYYVFYCVEDDFIFLSVEDFATDYRMRGFNIIKLGIVSIGSNPTVNQYWTGTFDVPDFITDAFSSKVLIKKEYGLLQSPQTINITGFYVTGGYVYYGKSMAYLGESNLQVDWNTKKGTNLGLFIAYTINAEKQINAKYELIWYNQVPEAYYNDKFYILLSSIKAEKSAYNQQLKDFNKGDIVLGEQAEALAESYKVKTTETDKTPDFLKNKLKNSFGVSEVTDDAGCIGWKVINDSNTTTKLEGAVLWSKFTVADKDAEDTDKVLVYKGSPKWYAYGKVKIEKADAKSYYLLDCFNNHWGSKGTVVHAKLIRTLGDDKIAIQVPQILAGDGVTATEFKDGATWTNTISLNGDIAKKITSNSLNVTNNSGNYTIEMPNVVGDKGIKVTQNKDTITISAEEITPTQKGLTIGSGASSVLEIREDVSNFIIDGVKGQTRQLVTLEASGIKTFSALPQDNKNYGIGSNVDGFYLFPVGQVALNENSATMDYLDNLVDVTPPLVKSTKNGKLIISLPIPTGQKGLITLNEQGQIDVIPIGNGVAVGDSATNTITWEQPSTCEEA